MPHHWTKIGETRLADHRDDFYEDPVTGETYVLGWAHPQATRQEIAGWYDVPVENVLFPLTKKLH